MKFIHYISHSIVDSYDKLLDSTDFVVYLDGGQYYFAAHVNNNVYAVFLWDDYSQLNKNDISTTAKLKLSEAKQIYQETIQVVFDRFPKAIKNEVYALVHTHHSNVPYNRWDSIEVVDKRINPYGYNIVKLYSNSNNDNWWLFLCDQQLFSLNNEKSAKRIYQLILIDCLNLMRERWK